MCCQLKDDTFFVSFDMLQRSLGCSLMRDIPSCFFVIQPNNISALVVGKGLLVTLWDVRGFYNSYLEVVIGVGNIGGEGDHPPATLFGGGVDFFRTLELKLTRVQV